ncbi:MAG TPA: hypothetical protein VLK26_10370 [Rudaea sp.]|nr:hypothetical protein [Rudaea sp.]
MIKPFVFTALVLGATPLAAFADPMSVGGDGNLLAANAVASPAASSGGSASVSDPADAIDDDAVREPLATPEPAARRTARQQPDTAHPPGQHAPAHSGSTMHKKAEPTRWQSLLPGVMK